MLKALYCAHVTPYPSDPASEDCLASHPGSSSLVSVLEAKCDEAACSSLRACLLDPAGDLNTAHDSLNNEHTKYTQATSAPPPTARTRPRRAWWRRCPGCRTGWRG